MNIKQNLLKLCYKLPSAKSYLKNLFNKFKTASYFEDQSLKPLGDNPIYKRSLSISVNVEKGKYSRIYWFYYNGAKWIFTGITGVG